MVDMQTALDELVAEIGELRPLPAAAGRVLMIAEGDRFSAHELAQAISADPALTAKLLRLANSAYYGFPRRISTVRDAVVLLGFRTVRSSALASSVMEAVGRASSLDRLQFWRFSVAVGMLAEVMARARVTHASEAFTAGVLHNIGLIVLDQHRGAELAEIRRRAADGAVSVHAAEREVLGFSSAEVGGALALHWNFPEPLAEAIRRHPLDAADLPDPDSLAAHVVRARIFAHASGITDGLEPARVRPMPREWTEPVVSAALSRIGGIDGVRQRVNAFVDAALADV